MLWPHIIGSFLLADFYSTAAVGILVQLGFFGWAYILLLSDKYLIRQLLDHGVGICLGF